MLAWAKWSGDKHRRGSKAFRGLAIELAFVHRIPVRPKTSRHGPRTAGAS